VKVCTNSFKTLTLNTVRTKEFKQEVNVRLGINSGKVIQGDIGTVERKDLTVIGDAVNIAARIQTVTAPNSISISEATFSRLKNPSSFKFKEEVIVKGKKQSVRIFRHISYPTHSGVRV
jgi:adenylate cyclase